VVELKFNQTLYLYSKFDIMKKIYFASIFALAGLFLSSCLATDKPNKSENQVNEEEKIVNIYTDRHYDVDTELYKQFEAETGIKVNAVEGKTQELLERLEKEGDNSKADIYFTADIARLFQAKDAGFFQASSSEKLNKNIPSHLRGVEGSWYGLTKRARVIVYSNERVKPEMLTTYEDLANERWKGKIAVRSGSNVYNQSLLASIIASNGEETAQNWAEGVVKNMYQSPSGNDRDQVKAIYAGKADLAIVNTYYVGKLLSSDDELERKAGESISIFYPNQSDRGAHVNVSGVGIVKSAPNKENAMKLIEFLSSEVAQIKLAEANFEYPVNPSVKASDMVASWGAFKEDTVALSKIGQLNTAAIKVFDRAGWK